MAMPGYKVWVLSLSLSLLPYGFAAAAQSQGTGASPVEHPSDPRLSGSISGTIVDPTRAAVVGARVRLSWGDQSLYQEVTSDDEGSSLLRMSLPGPSSSPSRRWVSQRRHPPESCNRGRATLSRRSPWLLLPPSRKCVSCPHGWKWRKIRSRRKRSSECSASFQISM